MPCTRRGIWKGDILIADIEELEEMDVSEFHARRLNAKEVLTPMRGDNFIFPVATGTVKISGGGLRLRTPTLIRDRPDREEQEILQGESDNLSSPTPRQDDSTLVDAEAKNDFWSFSGDSFVAITWNPHSINLYMLREESFPIPLKYIDVTRNTHTSLDVSFVDGERELSDAWTGFTRLFH